MEYKCGSCREISALSPKARFCPVCGSSSLVLVVRELVEPTQKETVGVYNTATIDASHSKTATPTESEPDVLPKEEEDRPRRRR